MQQARIPIIIESDPEGYYITCPSLPGCYSEGESYDEAMANITDSIRQHGDERLSIGAETPPQASVGVSDIAL